MKISVIIFLIISIGIIVYSNSLGNDFVWDDTSFVVQNDLIKDLRLAPLYFTSKSALAKGGLAAENYRPFLALSYAIDYFFWKLNPLGYHITNLFFHIGNALLVFYLVLMLTQNRVMGLFSSLFFLTHPVQTEAVTWISGRADVLFLFFYLAALISYINYRKNNKLVLYFISLILFSCSLLSKEMAATLPLVVILYDYLYPALTPNGGIYRRKEKLSAGLVRYFAFFLILESYVFLRFNIIGKLAQTDYWTGQAYTTFLTMAKGIVYYIRLLVCPMPLCVDYLTFPMSFSIKEPQVALSITAIVFLLMAGIFLAKRNKHVSFSILWFFITLAPAANIIPIKILIAERFLYLPSIGYCLAIAVMITILGNRFRQRRIVSYSLFSIAIFLVISYSHLTLLRNDDWQNELTLWKRAVEQYPDNARAHHNLAVAYVRRGNDLEKAYKEAKTALEIAPEYPLARLMLAGYYAQKEKFDDAVREAKRVLKDDPDFLQAYQMLGSLYAIQGEYDLALNEYKKALAKNAGFIQAEFAMANIYSMEGNPDLAIEKYHEILKAKPAYHYSSHYAAAYLRMGELYADMNKPKEAIRAWEKVSRDFKHQIWFNEVSKFLVDKITKQQLLKETENWQPEFKIICYYYIGIKNQMNGDKKKAKIYYQKCKDIKTQTIEQFKVLATERLEKLGGE